jgi:hypothetical protein
LKRFTISLAGSTSSSGIGVPFRNLNRPRIVQSRRLSSFTSAVYSRNIL